MPNNYIQSLDGARALAVIAVIFFHALPDIAPGGFIGVDIFFVISGYVITKKILHEVALDSFRFSNFYLGRAKRLLPLLFLVSFVTAVAAMMLAPPKQVIEFGRSLVATQLYASNIYFWRTLGYFEAGESFQPLLHTWSLSVEEQFYLLFPLFLVYVGRRYPKVMPMTVAILMVASVLFSELMLKHHANVSFYLIPSRGFELLVGALLLIGHNCYKREVELLQKFSIILRILGVVSFGVLIFQIIFNPFGEPFPGVHALWISLFAAVLIHDCVTHGLIDRILSLRPLTHLGYISYGLYLWHLPILEIFKQIDSADTVRSVVLSILITYILALSSGRLIERPIWRSSLKKSWVMAMSVVPVFLSISFALAIESTHGFRDRFLARLDAGAKANYELIETYANPSNLELFSNSTPCSFIGEFTEKLEARILNCLKSSHPILVFGDSHAMNLFNAIFSAYGNHNVIAIASGGCALGNEARKCDMNRIVSFISRNKDRFSIILYTEAGFRLFKTSHGIQSERQNFNSASSIESLQPDIDKIGHIASVFRREFFDVPFYWVGAWAEPHYDLYSLRNIKQLDRLTMSKTYKHFEKIDSLSANSMRADKIEKQYISSDRILQLNESTEVVRNQCLMFADRDHLSSCGESILGIALLSMIGDGKASEKRGEL